nr:unnamed protein product [Callosobruchus chinensis]
MDLAKVPNEKKLSLCQWYFRIGFLFLPFVWAVNAIWFFNEAFRKPAYEEQKRIKKCKYTTLTTKKKLFAYFVVPY